MTGRERQQQIEGPRCERCGKVMDDVPADADVEHPGPPDVPGQEKCERCGGFLGDDAYGKSRMCRCARTFNAANGLQVERLRDGAVRVVIESPEGDRAETWVDPQTWCSVIAHMGHAGGTSRTFADAQRLHIGLPGPADPPDPADDRPFA